MWVLGTNQILSCPKSTSAPNSKPHLIADNFLLKVLFFNWIWNQKFQVEFKGLFCFSYQLLTGLLFVAREPLGIGNLWLLEFSYEILKKKPGVSPLVSRSWGSLGLGMGQLDKFWPPGCTPWVRGRQGVGWAFISWLLMANSFLDFLLLRGGLPSLRSVFLINTIFLSLQSYWDIGGHNTSWFLGFRFQMRLRSFCN